MASYNTLPVIDGCDSLTKENYCNWWFLNWTSANDFNSSHFDIERSIDGIKFNKIGSVNAIGNTAAQNDYQFIDKQIPVSPIIY